MTLAVLLSLAAATPAVPSPPPPILLPPPRTSSVADVPVSFDVEVRVGSDVLWSGVMRVSDRTPGRFERRKTDAADEICPAGRYSQGESTNLSLTLGKAAGDIFRLTVNWVRPAPGEACVNDANNRTVALQQGLSLKPNEALTIHGDGDLTVRLRRR